MVQNGFPGKCRVHFNVPGVLLCVFRLLLVEALNSRAGQGQNVLMTIIKK
jgi:hypothetical protein